MLYIKYLFVLVVSIMVISCGIGKEEPVILDYDDPEVLLKVVRDKLGDKAVIVHRGNFDSDTLLEVAAGLEIEDGGVWGIQFVFFKQKDNDFEEVYRTPLLEGSFDESANEKIKFTAKEYEMLYYSSEGYFLGSGGGEVFSYIVDFPNKEVYYAHLISEGDGILLFLSDNFKQEEVKNFFVTKFKRDYPNLNIVTEDINLND